MKLGRAITDSIAKRPQDTVMVYPGRDISGEELLSLTASCTLALKEKGIKAGDWVLESYDRIVIRSEAALDGKMRKSLRDIEQIGELAAEGFMHFKIEGRNISPNLFTRYCMSFILGKEKSAEIQSAMDNREIIELLLLMTQNADLEKRMEMAHSPA